MRLGERLRQERLRRHLSQEALAEALGISAKSIGRWEQGRVVPQGSVRLQLSRFFHISPEELFADLEAQGSSALIWTVPFPRNPYFTGREEILQALHDRLMAPQAVALTQAPALSGLGGIGKTQVVIEYAYRYAQEYNAVFWLATETSESLTASLQVIADQLRLSERQEAEQSTMVAAVQRWLMTHPGWLLIADNVEDPDLLQGVLPPVRQGALLLTTRRQALGTLAEPLELPPMTGAEGVTLVLRRARWFNTSTSDSSAQQESWQDGPAPAGAAELVAYLEGLPLALDQAGAYIEETGCSVENYLQRCREQRKQVLARRGVHGGAHPASVAATLKLAIEQAEREHPAAASLLRTCAFLHPEAIPEELFQTGAAYLEPVLAQAAADAYQFDHTLAALRGASLLKRQTGTRTFAVHRLVQAVLQDEMEPAEMRVWSERVIRAVNAAFPQKPEQIDTWPQCERYLVHAQACVPLIERAGSDLPEASELLYKAGSYHLGRGRNNEASFMLKRAVSLREHLYGSNHPALIPLLNKQGEIFWLQGNYEQAELVWDRALTLGKQHLGPVHPLIATTLCGLADAHRDQEKYEQAERLYQQALSMNEQLWGSEHPEVAEILDCLAILYWSQEKYEQAVPLYRRAIRIQEQHLGSDHPRTAITLYNLATLYRDQEKYEQAEPLYLRILRIREQRLGPDHLATATALHGLATVYLHQGKYEQAEPLYLRSLSIREKQEPEHLKTAITLNCLATLYREQGRYEEAKSLYQRVLRIREQRLGSEHPDTVATRDDLAALFFEPPC